MYVHDEKLFSQQFSKNILFIIHIMISEKITKTNLSRNHGISYDRGRKIVTFDIVK